MDEKTYGFFCLTGNTTDHKSLSNMTDSQINSIAELLAESIRNTTNTINDELKRKSLTQMKENEI